MPVRQYTPQDYLNAVIRNNGSRVKAAAEMDVGVRHVFKMLEICKKRGLEIPSAFAPKPDDMIQQVEAAHQAAPEHYHVKGVSSYYKDGVVTGQWVKTDQNAEQRMRQLQAAVEAMKVGIKPQKPVKAPKASLDHLCNTYVFTDYHMGMLAWWKEGGADWDLNIAETVLMGCFEHMLAQAPQARVGILAQLGDFLHTDGLIPQTPTSHHTLDADSRFQKIVAVTIRFLRKIVNRMLEKHAEVHILMAEGNHDIVSSIWLQQMFAALYENEPRCKVIDSPLPYYAIQHGKVMISFHHGHLTKFDKLAGLMPAQFPEMWGATKYRYCHSGHLHHIKEKEDAGILLVQHPTLASRDAFASRGGWHAERGARCETYHDEFGQVARTIVNPEMIR
jgi:hypothetical protein